MEKNFYKRKAGLSYRRMALLICAIFWASLANADVLQGKGKPERLENYLKKIEQTYKISFVYDASEISKTLVLDVPEKLGTIKESLDQLKQKNIGYTQLGSQVILKVQTPLPTAVKKDVVVRGAVKDKANGQPVPGVSVFVKGTSAVVSTNENGEYSIYSTQRIKTLAEFLKTPAEYFAILAYLPRTDNYEVLKLIQLISNKANKPVTFGWGPRYLHSTGQLHKGGQPNGCFVQITSEIESELAVPGESFMFSDLIQAQSLGDALAITERKLPLIRIHLKNNNSALKQLITEL